MTLTQDLQRVHSNAAEMQFFTPSRGYNYVQQSSKRGVAGPASARGSRLNTPMPDAADEMAGQGDANGQEHADDDAVDEHDLLRALNLSMRYEDDYMDLNPLSGEPGSLVLSSTQGHLRAEKAAKALAAQKAKLEARLGSVSAAASPLTGPRKGVKSEKEKTPAGPPSNKLKRRKSRMTGSPDGD
jgi:mediator of RNA polymerase II transcription subunit 6